MDSTPWAVLVVAYRSADLLETCLTSVERYLPDAEVHVWDNSGPGHDAVRGLARRMPAVHWYLGGDNIGFAAAVNALASQVPGRDLLLLNPDAELLGLAAAALREVGGAKQAHVKAWKRPSQNMLTFIATRSVGGIWLESMLCHWSNWCSRMPSRKPPRPVPSNTPAEMTAP